MTDEFADAIWTRVFTSPSVGLEIYYQEKVYIKDLQPTLMFLKLNK